MTSVCVHGLGFVGLPTAAILATHGIDVVGYDTDSDRRHAIKAGEVDTTETDLENLIAQARAVGRLEVVTSPPAAEYHLICVPTPLSPDRNPDVSHVEAAVSTIAPLLREEDTVVLESTVPPGTTESVVRPILEAEIEFDPAQLRLAYSPETILPGNSVTELRHNDRIVGGIDDRSTRSAVDLYERFSRGVIHTTTATTAEFVKLAQNASRDVDIAFANELAMLAREYDISSREAIAKANTHPRVDILDPGPGVGGHCLPVDPWFLIHGAEAANLLTRARRVNDGMADFVKELLRAELGSLAGTTIAILGVAYKANVSDTRESPGLRLGVALREASDPAASGSEKALPDVRYNDPVVESSEKVPMQPLPDAVRDADAAVLVTGHDAYANLDPSTLGPLMARRVVVDTRDVLDAQRWREAGFRVLRL